MNAVEQARRLLLMVGELHNQGYQRLRVAPRFADSPGGPVWQCRIVPDFFTHEKHGAVETNYHNEFMYFYSTRGARGFEKRWSEIAKEDAHRSALAFVFSNLNLCYAGQGSDSNYVDWYSQMLSQTEPDGIFYVGPRDLQGPGPVPDAPPGTVAVFRPSRSSRHDYLPEPPLALIHKSKSLSFVTMVRKISSCQSQDVDRSFWKNVLETYESVSPEDRQYLRSAVRANSEAKNQLLCDDVLKIGEGPFFIDHTDGVEGVDVQQWLREVLCVISITDGFDDSRDTMTFLPHLWKQAEEAGIDPSPHFQHYAEISSEIREHTICGPTKLLLQMMLDPAIRENYE